MEQSSSSSSDSKLTATANVTVEFYSDLGKRYENLYGHDPGLHEVVRRFLGLLPASDARVLDCGCGTGEPVARMIAARGHRVLGIDMSQTMVDLSRQAVPTGSFECVNMLDYEAPTDHFHGVVVSLALFRFDREQMTLMATRWFQWLQPGGLLILVVCGAEDHGATPEMYDSDGECARGIPVRFMNRQIDVTLFTKQGWNNLVTIAGLEIVYTETGLFVPPAEAGSSDEIRYYMIARKPVTA